MGIKGIYGEIGPGDRIAVSKLAIEHLEKTSRPIRIAIDVSIWQFQTQAGQGGTNPALRTFYYRLLRLLSSSVQPLFVFDGQNKPPFKRGKKTGQHGGMVSNFNTKQLLTYFGFPYHTAPGEAEAECALLQKEGIVDAVLSEDVDTLMFGCGRTLRNWSSEGSKGNKSPTHVSVYDAKATKEGKSGLDREGMVLVALMSGGDYITEGIPGCGIKVACEAARAGYGKSLCRISRNDTAALADWRNNLAHEIQTNESKHFRVKHKALKIPERFPDREVLGYYTHPVVSSATRLEKLKAEINWDGEIDVQGLRAFVAGAFEWTHKIGAAKFIRGLAPALLVHKLRVRANRRDSGYGDLVLTAMNEMEIVRKICGMRSHFSTDGIPEFRVVYSPIDIVGLDMDAEEDNTLDYGRDGLAPINDEDEVQAYESDNIELRSASPSKREASKFDPTQLDKAWIPETIVKLGVPLKAEDYAESLRQPKKTAKSKTIAKKSGTEKAVKGTVNRGAMDQFVKITKRSEISEAIRSPREIASSQRDLPPVFLAPALEQISSSKSAPATTRTSSRPARVSTRSTAGSTSASGVQPTSKQRTETKVKPQKPITNTNPWSLAASSPRSGAKITKAVMQPQKTRPRSPDFQSYTVDLSSSPPPSPKISPPRKHDLSPSLSDSPNSASDELPPLPPSIQVARGNRASAPDHETPTKSRSQSRPSPRKKRSPPTAPEPSYPERPSTPTPSAPIKDNHSESFSSPEFPKFHSSPDKTYETQSIIDLLSSSPINHPSPSRCSNTMENAADLPTASPEIDEQLESKAKDPFRKKFIMVRDSLPGNWKAIDDEEREEEKEPQASYQNRKKKIGERWRLSQVELLDLCDDD